MRKIENVAQSTSCEVCANRRVIISFLVRFFLSLSTSFVSYHRLLEARTDFVWMHFERTHSGRTVAAEAKKMNMVTTMSAGEKTSNQTKNVVCNGNASASAPRADEKKTCLQFAIS